MLFQLSDGNSSVMNIEADNIEEAQIQLRRAGIRNQSQMFQLVQID